MKSLPLGFIGAGRITKIIFQALTNANIAFDQTLVFDVNDDALKAIKTKFPQVTTTGQITDLANAELVVLAVHPPMVMETLEKIKPILKPGTALLSLSPKFTIEKISTTLNGFANVARMNPSASTIVNKGVNPISFSDHFDKTKKQTIIDLLQPIGYMPQVADSKIEAYAVISAMGHTYFNFQLQKLKELAVSFGMDEIEAAKTISNMLWGTTETLFNSGLTYNEVADLVPVKPMAEVEETIKGYYDQYLTGIFNKIKP